MLIKRTDLREPVTVEFTGVFGETPANYRFERDGGDFTCDIADPIVIRRLLSIPVYVLATPGDVPPAGPTPTPVVPTGGPLDPSPQVSPAPPVKLDMTAARAYYTEVVGKKPFGGWNVDELLKRIDAHIAGEPKPAANDDGGDEPDDGDEG